jgi:hypothetical protein
MQYTDNALQLLCCPTLPYDANKPGISRIESQRLRWDCGIRVSIIEHTLENNSGSICPASVHTEAPRREGLGHSTGNPWVFLGPPAPNPHETRTHKHYPWVPSHHVTTLPHHHQPPTTPLLNNNNNNTLTTMTWQWQQHDKDDHTTTTGGRKLTRVGWAAVLIP